MRYRSRSRPYAFSVRSSDGFVQSRSLDVEVEEISDVSNGLARPRGSPLTHSKVLVFPRHFDSVDDPNLLKYTGQVFCPSAHEVKQFMTDGIPFDRMPELEDRLRELILDEETRIFEQWSSLNFLAELGEVPQLMETITRSFRNAGERLLSPSRRTSDNVIHNVRNRNYLEYQFGVAPIISDLSALAGNIRAVFGRMERLLSQSGIPRRFFRSKRLRVDLSGHMGGSTSAWAFSDDFSARLRATGILTATYPGLPEVLEDLYHTLDLLGIHPDLAALWDGVPFTWLIDWIIPIGDHLERLHSRGWHQPVLTVDGSITMKVAGSLKIFADPDGFKNSLFWSNVYQQQIGTAQFSLYTRKPIGSLLPQREVPLIQVPRLPWRRAAILASLAQANIRRN